MYLNVTLWTLNMVCRKFKIYISSFSRTCSYESISHMNEVKAESPSTMPIISKLYPYSLQSYWTSKFEKIIPNVILAHKRALPCVTKIILTQNLFGIGSSHFGFVRRVIPIFATRPVSQTSITFFLLEVRSSMIALIWH